MGRISFCLYLIHELFTEWAIVDTYYYFLGKGVSQNLSVLYAWLIFTPVLIFVSWVLTVLVDDSSKDFAYDIDITLRISRPPPPKKKDEEPVPKETYYSCWSFTKRSWKIFALLIYYLIMFIVT